MKRISVLIALLALVLFSGAANAAETEYKVKRGDTLWGIAHCTWGTGKLWTKIAEANNIKDPRKLKAGKTLRIPEITEVIKIVTHNTSPYGAKAMKGDPRVLSGIEKTFYSADVKVALKKYVNENTPSKYILMKGEWVECASDKAGVYCSSAGFEFAWEKIGALRADIWSVEIENKKYEIFVIEICGNFASRHTEVPQITVEAPPVPSEPMPSPPAVEEAPVLKKPELKLPPVTKPVIKLPVPACCPPEHEPIVGAGTWGNGIAWGTWYYGEYLIWLKPDCDSEYAFGAGIYFNGETGKSITSDYRWWGFGAGPQIGVKRYWFYTDKFGLDRPQQWTVKARLEWETLQGKNPTSGYSNKQNDKKVGFYAEYIRQMSEKWIGSLTAEGWYNFDRHLTTTWKGDSPSDRTQINLGIFGQYKVDENWQLKVGGGPFYQGWDQETGLHLRAELRYKETVMFGPYLNLFPYKTSAYEGIPLYKLQTLGGFVRVEFGPIIRDWDYARRAKRIQKYQRELNPEGSPEPAYLGPELERITDPMISVPVMESKKSQPAESMLAASKLAPVQENNPEIVNKSIDSAEKGVDRIAEPARLESQTSFDQKIDQLAWPN
jgi:LysM repeat protein